MSALLPSRFDWTVLIVCVAAVSLLAWSADDLRGFTTNLGVVVFGLLVWRLVATWRSLTVLEHAMAMLLAAAPLVASIASLGLQQQTALPPNPWIWLPLLHRLACLILVVFWTRWLGRRHSPFRRTTTAPVPAR